MRTLLSLAAACLVAAASSTSAAAEPKTIKPDEARNHVGETCTTTFKVRHTKHGVHRKTYFLDSEENFRAEKNLGVQISEEVAAKLKEKGVDAPHTHYADKTIRVTGPIFLQEGGVYLRIEDPDRIALVDDAP